VLFNNNKNILLASSTEDKVKEFMDKIESMYENLPFFMKPGCDSYGVLTKSFDNGCTIYGQTTTENTGAGLTIHLAILDEFALVAKNIKNKLYRTLIPTLSSSNIASLIIMSTPRGRDKFYEIYNKAVNGKNKFNPIRVDWWEVPLQDDEGNALVDGNGNIIYRDEKWKREMIDELGSEEDFNQEFGNQFLSGNSLLFQSSLLRKLKSLETKFVYYNDYEDIDHEDTIKYLSWHKDFNLDKINNGKFIISVDLGGGTKRDYTIFNIFKLTPMTEKEINKLSLFLDRKDFFKLVQIGIWKSNILDVESASKAFYHLIQMFDQEYLRVVLENNYEGNYFRKCANTLYGEKNNLEEVIWLEFPYNMIWESAQTFKVGINNSNSIKSNGCKTLVTKFKHNQIIITEEETVNEALSFSENGKGTYEAQSGHDDSIMSCVNLTHFFSHEDFEIWVEEYLENLENSFNDLINQKLEIISNDEEEFGIESLNYWKDEEDE
jgi:hypothetical protein